MSRVGSCTEIVDEIPFYCYGEVSSETEERIESHLADCAGCRGELARHKAFLEMMDTRALPSAMAGEDAMLAACRHNLRAAMAVEAETPSRSGLFSGWTGNWGDALRNFSRFQIPFQVPVGAVALVALGFFAARVTPTKFGGVQAGVAGDAMFSNVRSVEADPSGGGVRIAVDEVRRRVVTGNPRDAQIQELLVSAAREESNPGVRVESITILKNGADLESVRTALLGSLTHDPNPAVRLKALEGLKAWAGNPTVRRSLADVLLRDDNPDVRIQAIDILTAHRDDSIVGVLQHVVQREDNAYVRTRTTKLLEEMGASVGTY